MHVLDRLIWDTLISATGVKALETVEYGSIKDE
jgi:hypothetical protein